MMRVRFRLLHKNQRGLTLVELLIAIVLVGIVTAGITITIGHMFTWTTRTNNHMIAVRQVQTAGYWVSRDALQAQEWTISLPGSSDPMNSGFPFSLKREWDDETTQVTYSITEDNRLMRTRKITKITEDGDVTSEVSTFVAQHICFDGTTIERRLSEGKEVLTLQVTATVAEQSETRVYDITPRPDA